MSGLPWTPEDESRLCACWAAGDSVREIAVLLYRTPAAIIARAQFHGRRLGLASRIGQPRVRRQPSIVLAAATKPRRLTLIEALDCWLHTLPATVEAIDALRRLDWRLHGRRQDP